MWSHSKQHSTPPRPSTAARPPPSKGCHQDLPNRDPAVFLQPRLFCRRGRSPRRQEGCLSLGLGHGLSGIFTEHVDLSQQHVVLVSGQEHPHTRKPPSIFEQTSRGVTHLSGLCWWEAQRFGDRRLRQALHRLVSPPSSFFLFAGKCFLAKYTN